MITDLNYNIDEIIKIYDKYNDEGYQTIDSELIYSSIMISLKNKINIDNIRFFAEKIKNENNVDFVLIKKEGIINAIHVTHEYNKKFIEKNGLTEGNGDFGYGLYAIIKDNDIAMDNLKTYIVDAFKTSENNLVLCNINYDGVYYECINKCSNEGYLLLYDSFIKSFSMQVIPINQFL